MDPERDPWPSVEDPPEREMCPMCEALPTEPHGEHCPLFSPMDDPTTAAGRSAFRRRQALRASPEQVVTWLRQHAKGMADNSHARLYIERAISFLEAQR